MAAWWRAGMIQGAVVQVLLLRSLLTVPGANSAYALGHGLLLLHGHCPPTVLRTTSTRAPLPHA